MWLEAELYILALPATKTSKNKEESVCLRSAQGPTLGNFTANQFRTRLQSLLSILHLQSFNFTGYSLRRGGASHTFTLQSNFDALLVAGRWQSVKTARQYFDSGGAALVQLTPKSRHLVDHFQRRITQFCEQRCASQR